MRTSVVLIARIDLNREQATGTLHAKTNNTSQTDNRIGMRGM